MNTETALSCLIQNSIDANATEIRIYFEEAVFNEKRHVRAVHIQDNGTGFHPHALQTYFSSFPSEKLQGKTICVDGRFSALRAIQSIAKSAKVISKRDKLFGLQFWKQNETHYLDSPNNYQETDSLGEHELSPCAISGKSGSIVQITGNSWDFREGKTGAKRLKKLLEHGHRTTHSGLGVFRGETSEIHTEIKIYFPSENDITKFDNIYAIV